MSANTSPKLPPKTPSQPSKEDILLTQEMYHKLRPQLVLASLGALLVGIAYVFLPAQLTVAPTWLPLALAIAVVIPLFSIGFFHPQPYHSHHIGRWLPTALQPLPSPPPLTSIIHYVT